MNDYQELISVEGLFQAFDEFKKGKRKKIDVQEFLRNWSPRFVILISINLFNLTWDIFPMLILLKLHEDW